ncbi:hypothetical protein [Streptomyces sp. NPDC053542]|uniref:hypothetical protein n=1 Tax=Streptomyces sp. NPDC053542 TaxID=3365710 RepID=UPI0037D47FA3
MPADARTEPAGEVATVRDGDIAVLPLRREAKLNALSTELVPCGAHTYAALHRTDHR